jgi:small nuclear ribonucleoprotein (snRNP)-like protein
MLLYLKERVKTIDRETNACQDDAVQLAAYKKDISAFDEDNRTTSRKRSARIINKGNNIYVFS